MQMFTDLKIDFVGKRNIAILCSILCILMGLVSVFMHGGLNYGIDFAGGSFVQVKFNQTITADEVREALDDLGLNTITIQRIGSQEDNEVLIRLSEMVEKEVDKTPSVIVIKKLREVFGVGNFEIRRTESVGPTIGEELKRSAMGAITGAIIMILLYITFRFEFKFAVGAIAALIHDVLFTVGIFSITDREFSLPVIAALLTIVGYSLNDTIVVYDRIRENLRLMHREKFVDIINASINQTLSRTLLTSVTTLVVVLCLYYLGGEVINDFAFALLIGIVVGTYSSIFVASPVLIWWRIFDTSKPKAGAKNRASA
jgi:preprotein translocase subunit SecF